jgi:hypothetical protein
LGPTCVVRQRRASGLLKKTASVQETEAVVALKRRVRGFERDESVKQTGAHRSELLPILLRNSLICVGTEWHEAAGPQRRWIAVSRLKPASGEELSPIFGDGRAGQAAAG